MLVFLPPSTTIAVVCIIAGLTLASSLVVFVSVLSDGSKTDLGVLGVLLPYTIIAVICIIAGLTLASGLVVFVSVLSDAYQDRPRRAGGSSPFHYQYGWSFVTAGAAFVLAEGAALLSMTSYLKRFATVEDMVRTMVPGADRHLQERQLCKEYLVKRTSSV